MLLEHQGKAPQVHPAAYVAPTATLCGDVTVGADSRVLFGAVLTAEGGPVRVGQRVIVMEQAVLRGTARHPLQVGDDVLIGPRAYLTGCTVEDEAFLATGSTVFNAARVGRGATVRINGTVHLRTTLPPGVKLPIGWVAIGDPVELLPPGEHERIIALLGQLDFSGTVFGLPYRPDGRLDMPQVTGRYTRALGRHQHDRVVDGPGPAGP